MLETAWGPADAKALTTLTNYGAGHQLAAYSNSSLLKQGEMEQMNNNAEGVPPSFSALQRSVGNFELVGR